MGLCTVRIVTRKLINEEATDDDFFWMLEQNIIMGIYIFFSWVQNENLLY